MFFSSLIGGALMDVRRPYYSPIAPLARGPSLLPAMLDPVVHHTNTTSHLLFIWQNLVWPHMYSCDPCQSTGRASGASMTDPTLSIQTAFPLICSN